MPLPSSLLRHAATAFLGILAAAVSAQPQPTSFPDARRAVDDAVKAFRCYDRDQDGTPEIDALDKICEARGAKGGTVLVLVESRLLKAAPGLPDLRPSLRTLAGDIARDGENAFVLQTSFYHGPEHQDGLTLIAYRDFLRQVWLRVKDFKGVLLVGNFPQPFMVRQYAWTRDDPLTLFAGTKAQATFKPPWIRAVAEPVASPADIVLADLDGRWDRIYVKQPMNVTDLYAIFPAGSDVTENWEEKSERYEDFFFIQDGPWAEEPRDGHKVRFIFQGEKNEECDAADAKLPNPLAQPKIAVSRIDAYHAGVVPDPNVRGVNGEGLLDAAGHPETVDFGPARPVPHEMSLWVPSEQLERKLLLEYFARNHAYRASAAGGAEGIGAVSTGLGSDIDELKADVPGWKALDPKSKSFLDGTITLTDVVDWMKRPLLVREIRAHSNAVLSAFDGPPDVAALQAEVGRQAWYWTREGTKLVPSLKGVGGALGFGLLRTMYEDKTMPPNPVLYFHTGCEATRPIGAENLAFNAPDYAKWQLAECMTMYGNGLALIGRSKVFYDEPREFWKVLGQGGTFGEAWQRYFAVESQDKQLAKDGIGRKRTYFWSLVGDFTLRLPKDLVKR